ncbi:MAG: DUF6531 domain-containing protein, partial [Azoarcus sp.]|nr:DUF6531 domain-containing protein [Azoarcus sp.]
MHGGVACSVCLGGMAVGSPVNPLLGAKVLPGETDFALPAAALPLVWQRTYSSYVNAEHGGACGVLGHGWHVPTEFRLELQTQRTLLHDTHGRVITFDEALPPGAILHSPSEGLWLLRGGATKDTPEGADAGTLPAWARKAVWSHVPREWATNPECVFAAS